MWEPLINISKKTALLFAAFLVLYQFSTYIANDMIMPGMLAVTESFHANESAVATSLTAYILGGASLQLLLGPLSDAFGRRPVMLAGTIIFLIFTVFIALSQSIEAFISARFFEGMGLCFTGVVGYAALQETFEEMTAVRLTAILSNVATVSPLLGPLLGAVLIKYFHWRMVFVAIAVLGIIALLGLKRFMPETVGQVRLDNTVIEKNALNAKATLENYKRLLSHKRFIWGAIALGVMNIPSIAWIAVSPLILIAKAKLTVIDYGLWQIPIFSASILGNIVLHQLTFKKNLYQLINLATIYICTGAAILALLPLLLGANYHWIIIGMMIYSFGLGLGYAPLNRLVLFSTTVGKGTASAVISIITMILAAFGTQSMNFVYKTHNNFYFGLFGLVISFLYINTYRLMCHANR